MLNTFIQHTKLPYFKDGISVWNFSNSANWQELSGMATPTNPANKDYIWVVSDSPANMLACVSKADAVNRWVWTLQGVSISSPSDWEDLTSCRVNGISYLYVADFGDNPNTRTTINIHRAVEPNITWSDWTITSGNIHTIVCQFPGWWSAPTHKDCECLIADPSNGDLYFITKRESIPGVYYLAHQSTYSGTQTLTYLGKMYDIPDVTTVPLGATACNVVGGCISRDGKEIMIKNYDKIFYFSRPNLATSIYTTLTQTPIECSYVGGGSVTPAKSHPSQEPQGEAVCFDYEDQNYYTCSEYLTSEWSSASQYPLFMYERVSKQPTSITFQDGVSPTGAYAWTLDTYIWDTNPNTNYWTDTSMVVDTAIGVETDQRKSLLYFDISSIPTTAKVVSARLDLYINTEWQGWKFHKMLVPWNESSTYNSLSGWIDNDWIDASVAADCINGINLNGITGTVRNNMNLATIQDWITNPSNNKGWMIEMQSSATGDGIQFDTRQSVTASRRPKLIITYV